MTSSIVAGEQDKSREMASQKSPQCEPRAPFSIHRTTLMKTEGFTLPNLGEGGLVILPARYGGHWSQALAEGSNSRSSSSSHAVSLSPMHRPGFEPSPNGKSRTQRTVLSSVATQKSQGMNHPVSISFLKAILQLKKKS